MRPSGQFQADFLRKNFERTKTQSRKISEQKATKATVFCAHKNALEGWKSLVLFIRSKLFGKKTKNLFVMNFFRRNSVTYATPCHAIGHFVFWYRECYGFQKFLLSGVFYPTLLPVGFKASPGSAVQPQS